MLPRSASNVASRRAVVPLNDFASPSTRTAGPSQGTEPPRAFCGVGDDTRIHQRYVQPMCSAMGARSQSLVLTFPSALPGQPFAHVRLHEHASRMARCLPSYAARADSVAVVGVAQGTGLGQ